MPSRRAFLAALAATAGCTTRDPGTPTTEPTRTETTTATTRTTTRTTTTASPTSVAPPDGMAWGLSLPGSAGPVAAGESLAFVADDAGNLYGVDPASGDVVWSQSFPQAVGGSRGVDRTLVERDGALYVLTGRTRGAHGHDFVLRRLDPATGRVAWTARPGLSYRTLHVLDAAADAVLVGAKDDQRGDGTDPALEFDANTGDQRWSVRVGDADSGALGPTRAFVGTWASVSGVTRSAGERAWRRDVPDPTPVYRGPDDVFVASKEHGQSRAMALDPATGDPRWTFDDWAVTSLRYDADAGGPFVGGERVARLTASGDADWTYDPGGLIARAPVAGGVLYGLTDARVFGVTVDGGEEAFSYEPGWTYPRPVAVSGDVVVVAAGRSARLAGVRTDGTEAWRAAFDADHVGSVAVDGGALVVSQADAAYGRPVTA